MWICRRWANRRFQLVTYQDSGSKDWPGAVNCALPSYKTSENLDVANFEGGPSLFSFHRFANHLLEFLDTFVECGGDRQNRRFADMTLEFLQVLLSHGFIHFVGDDHARSF